MSSIYGELIQKAGEGFTAFVKRAVLTLAILAVLTLVVLGLFARHAAQTAWLDGFKAGIRSGITMERQQHPHPEDGGAAPPISCPQPEAP